MRILIDEEKGVYNEEDGIYESESEFTDDNKRCLCGAEL